MKKVDVRHAKTHLLQLLEEVQPGEEVVIAKAGKPMARLVSVRQKPKHRALGSAKGMFWMSDDFDAPLPPQIENSFWK